MAAHFQTYLNQHPQALNGFVPITEDADSPVFKSGYVLHPVNELKNTAGGVSQALASVDSRTKAVTVYPEMAHLSRIEVIGSRRCLWIGSTEDFERNRPRLHNQSKAIAVSIDGNTYLYKMDYILGKDGTIALKEGEGSVVACIAPSRRYLILIRILSPAQTAAWLRYDATLRSNAAAVVAFADSKARVFLYDRSLIGVRTSKAEALDGTCTATSEVHTNPNNRLSCITRLSYNQYDEMRVCMRYLRGLSLVVGNSWANGNHRIEDIRADGVLPSFIIPTEKGSRIASPVDAKATSRNGTEVKGLNFFYLMAPNLEEMK